MKLSQHEKILNYIDQFGSITTMEAFNDLGITKLATRVSELIRDGFPIQKDLEHGTNRFGESTHYMRYSIA